ncbi:Hypothetical protein SMAX5B_015430 [Scophthalmus maximus]|uniref:Uncharacterized protein n=1 Tax=Scophthalmus maximus TaxID=52904 RepID=A0A2U9BXN4_SCOMX|nr:Hypothetical protein SMAX5B_015430 [Scophthalmus maximus]
MYKRRLFCSKFLTGFNLNSVGGDVQGGTVALKGHRSGRGKEHICNESMWNHRMFPLFPHSEGTAVCNLTTDLN